MKLEMTLSNVPLDEVLLEIVKQFSPLAKFVRFKRGRDFCPQAITMNRILKRIVIRDEES